MSNATPGTGWAETFLGGSREAEQKILEEILPKVEEIQSIVSQRQNASIRRALHNKGTVVRIAFKVDDLPEYLQVGFLKPGASYEGFGRFSRSQSMFRADDSVDQRGFAFRVETDEGLRWPWQTPA